MLSLFMEFLTFIFAATGFVCLFAAAGYSLFTLAVKDFDRKK